MKRFLSLLIAWICACLGLLSAQSPPSRAVLMYGVPPDRYKIPQDDVQGEKKKEPRPKVSRDSLYEFSKEIRVMYGCSSADYDIDLVILNENGKPIKGIKVTVDDNVLYTNKKGEVHIELDRHFPLLDIKAEDVDGKKNKGLYQDVLIHKENLEMSQQEAGNGFYQGRFKARAEVKMKKK